MACSVMLPIQRNSQFIKAVVSPIVLALGYAGDSAYVFAQGEKLAQLEEVIVTARRREENLQDVPISVTAISEDVLRTQSIQQVEDLGVKVPSLRIHQAGGSLHEPVVTLRGQRQGEAAFNQDPAVPMYFNDIVIAPLQGSNIGLYDLQALQVLKGPKGTLFGKNSTGGAILMSPKQPGTELGGYAQLKTGDFGLFGFEGAVDIPVSDSFQMRLSARKQDRDGYQKNIADNELRGKDFRDEHYEGVRLGMFVDLDSFSNFTVLEYDEAHNAASVPVVTGINYSVGLGFAAAVSPAIAPWGQAVEENIERDNPWKVKTDLNGEEYVENTFFSNTTEFEVSDTLSLKNILGYRKVEFGTATDIDGTGFPVFGSVPEDGLLWAAGLPWTTTKNPPLNIMKSDFFSNEFQLMGSALDYKLDWIAGIYWSELDATQDRRLQQGPFTYDSGTAEIVNNTYGVFLEGTYQFSDQFSSTIGLRQSWDDRELSLSSFSDLARQNCTLSGVNGTALSVCERSVEESFSAPTGRITLNYGGIDDHLIYASLSSGYRAGGFNTRGRDDATLQPFEEETVLTYEIGHKADWMFAGMAIRSNTAIYFQNYEDIQNTVSFFENDLLVTRTENAAKAEISGVELDLNVAITEAVTVNFSYSYVDAEFTEREDFIGGVNVDTSGNDFSYVPSQTLTFSSYIDIPIHEDMGGFTIMVGAYWQSAMSTNPKAQQFQLMTGRTGAPWAESDLEFAKKFSRQGEYMIWNARADWRNVIGSNFDVAAYVNNATDEVYVLGGLNVLESGGYGAYHYGAPRTYGLELRFNF